MQAYRKDTDAGGDLSDLLLRMCPRIADVGNQAVDLPALYEKIAQDTLGCHGTFLTRGRILRGLHVDGSYAVLARWAPRADATACW